MTDEQREAIEKAGLDPEIWDALACRDLRRDV